MSMLRASALLIRMLPFAVLSLLLLRMVAPIVSYDSWWYHFPFSSCLYDINDGCRSFHMDPVSLARFDGFPKM